MALQIRGDQLKDIGNDSIKTGAGINLAKLALSDNATFAGNLTLSGTNEQSGILTISNDTESTSHADGSLIVSGGVGIAKKLFVNSDADITGSLVVDGDVTLGSDTDDTITIKGNLQVDGTTTTINSTTLDVDDLNITVAKGAANSAAADGAGLTIDTGEGASNPQLTWDATNSEFNFSHALKLDASLEVESNIISYGGNLSVLDNSNTTKFSVTASNGAVVAGSFSDGTTSMSGGALSGLTSVTSSSFQNAASDATFSVSSLGAVSGSSFTDGSASLTGGNLTGVGSITASSQIQFGTLSDGSVSLGAFVPSTISDASQRLDTHYDNNTTVPTTGAIIDYIDYKFQNTGLSGDVTGDLTGDVKNDDSTTVLDSGDDSQGLYIYSADGTSLVLDAGTDGSDSYFEGDIRKQDGTVIVDFDESSGIYFQGKVSDITNHDIDKLSDVSLSDNGLAVRDMLMVNSSSEIENVYEVIKYVSIDMSAGKGNEQAVSLDVDHNDDYESKAMIFLNGQKLRYGADENTNDFYFSAADTITFQDDTLANGDELEIRYLVTS